MEWDSEKEIMLESPRMRTRSQNQVWELDVIPRDEFEIQRFGIEFEYWNGFCYLHVIPTPGMDSKFLEWDLIC